MALPSNAITVWRFQDAPETYRNLSLGGGEDDWIVFVPLAFSAIETGLPDWVTSMDALRSPQVRQVYGGTVAIVFGND